MFKVGVTKKWSPIKIQKPLKWDNRTIATLGLVVMLDDLENLEKDNFQEIP